MLLYWLVRPWAITPEEQKEVNVTDFFSFAVAGYFVLATLVSYFISESIYRWLGENDESTIADVFTLLMILLFVLTVVSSGGTVVFWLISAFR